MTIHLRAFQGEVPRQKAKRLLQAMQATTAKNCRLWGNVLEGFKTTRRVYNPSKVGTKKSIYRWGKAVGADAEGAIAAVLNTAPVQIQANGHGQLSGARVFIGDTGLAIDNATYTITVVDADNFTLNGTAASGVSATGKWTKQNGYWFHWTTIVNALKAPIGGDTTERTLFTGDGVPKITDSSICTAGGGTDYPTNSYTLGVPAPAAAIVATVVVATGNITAATQANPCQITSAGHGRSTGDKVYIATVGGMVQLNGVIYTITVIDANNFTLDGINSTGYGAYTAGGTWTQRYDAANVSSVAYVYTYVSAWDEEGPPSAVSNIVDIGPGERVDLSAMSVGPGAGYNINRKRIYRAVTGSNGTTYNLVAEIVLANTTYTDTKKDAALGTELPSTEWDPPPTDMAGLVALPNGVVVGYSKNQVCPSVPSQPHAYPVGWRQKSDYDIVGLGAIHTTVVVCTRGQPYLAEGADPQNMSMVKITNNQGCVSGRGIVSVGGVGVVYPSPDGLILIQPGGGWQNITEAYFTRDEWQTLIKPESIHAYPFEDRYLAFYDNGTTQGGFIFSPKEQGQGLIFLDTYATAGYIDLEADQLFLQIGNYIERWEGGATRQTVTWKSKTHYGQKRKYTAAMVVADSYADMTVKLYANGGSTLVKTQVVTDGKPFRWKCNESYTDWVVEIITTDVVHNVIVCESVEQIARIMREAA